MLALAVGIVVFLIVRSNLFWLVVLAVLIASMMPGHAQIICDRPILLMTPKQIEACKEQAHKEENEWDAICQFRRIFGGERETGSECRENVRHALREIAEREAKAAHSPAAIGPNISRPPERDLCPPPYYRVTERDGCQPASR